MMNGPNYTQKYCIGDRVMVSDTWRKGRNMPSFTSAAVDPGRRKPVVGDFLLLESALLTFLQCLDTVCLAKRTAPGL